MTKIFCIEFQDSPGAVHYWTEAFQSAGFNIEGYSGFTHGGKAFFYFVSGQYDKVTNFLKSGDFKWTSHDCFFINMPNELGQLSKWSATLKDAGISIHTSFGVQDGYYAVYTDNNSAAIELAKQFGWLVEPAYT